MKINWTVRLKNPVFWATVIPALITIVYAVFEVFDFAPAITEDIATRIFTSLCSLLATAGVIIDHTTTGVSDSERALSYATPNGSDGEEFSDPVDPEEID